MGRGDEAFYEAKVKRVVGGAGRAGAVARLVKAVCAIATAGTLHKADVGVDGRDDATSLQGCESPSL